MQMRLGLRRAGARPVWPRELAALRRGRGGARPGVAPRPVRSFPSGSAAAPESAIFRGKPNDWTRMVQRVGPR